MGDKKTKGSSLNQKSFGAIFSSGGSAFEWLFLAAFAAQISFLFQSVILYLIKRPLPGVVAPLLSIISFVLFYICIMMYFKKNSLQEEINGSLFQNVLASGAGFIFLIFTMLLIAFGYRYLIKLLPALAQGNATSMAYFAAFVVAAIFSVLLIFIAIMYFITLLKYRVSILEMGRVFVLVLKTTIRKLPKTLFYCVLIVILLYLINILNNLVSELLVRTFAGGFLMIYLRYFFGAITIGYLFLVLINVCLRLMPENFSEKANESKKQVENLEVVKTDESNEQAKTNESNKQAKTNEASETTKKRLPLPIFPFVIIALTIVLVLMLSPFRANKADMIISEIKTNMQLGNTYGDMGLSRRSIYEYDVAYSKLLSLKAYLKGIYYQKTENNDFISQADQDLRQADGLSGKNSYLPYFRARIMTLSGSIDGAISQYKKTLLYNEPVNEAYFGLLKSYIDKNDKEKVKEILTLLITGEIFYDNISSLEKFSEGKLEKYIDKLQEFEDELAPKMVYKYVEKTKYNDMAPAQEGLMNLQQKFPQNAVINYFIAKVANLFKNEASQYPTITKYTKEFENLVDVTDSEENEVAATMFSVQMYMGAGDFATAEERLRQIYSKYPQNIEVVEQYGYILNKNKRYDDALSILQKGLEKDKEAYSFEYLSAMAYIGKGDVENSLKSFVRFQDIVSKKPELLPILDKYLYSYCLAFTPLFKGEDVLAKVEGIKANTILYNYLYAIKGWKDRNSTASLESIAKVLVANDKLGYAFYIQGINFYEDTVRNGKSDFSKAEEYYLKSLQIIPEHAEGYFALAHCYKKWGKNLEALRAFRKVVDLMPFEDHRTDPYGLTVHAIGEISALAQYEK